MEGSARSQLHEWGNDLASQIDFQSGCDLAKYDRISPVASQWIIIGDGDAKTDCAFTVIEEGDPSNFVGGLISVKPWQDDSIFEAPKSFAVGGTKARLYGKKLQDGTLILCYYDFESSEKQIDEYLRSSVGQFGYSTAKALTVRTRDADKALNWAILDSWGNLLYQSGCLPLQSKASVPPGEGFRDFQFGTKHYLLLSLTVTDKGNHRLASVILPSDMSYAAEALASQRNFDLILAAASFVCFLLISARHLDRTESRRELLESTFEKYVSKQVLTTILRDPGSVRLGGEGKGVTVFFSDIRGFTPIAERLEPEGVVGILNRYFEVMTEEILKTGGTVDKYIGDAIMAFWGAPIEDAQQAEHAVQASLAMLQKLDQFNNELAAEGYPKIEIRIGLHTGRAVVGNVGSSSRFDYTVIGDTVNAASRMEGLNKEHGTQIIISDMVRNFLKDKNRWKPLGPVTVKGKSEAINVYTLA